MMLLLVEDVGAHRLQLAGAHREGGIALLPLKGRISVLDGPAGTRFLQFPDEIRKPVSGAQSDQQMDVIGHAANGQRDGLESPGGSAKIFVKAGPPRRSDP